MPEVRLKQIKVINRLFNTFLEKRSVLELKVLSKYPNQKALVKNLHFDLRKIGKDFSKFVTKEEEDIYLLVGLSLVEIAFRGNKECFEERGEGNYLELRGLFKSQIESMDSKIINLK